jgi:hypothetical protein
MDIFIRFLFDFMSQFFGGILKIVQGLLNGLADIFNFGRYFNIVSAYSQDFSLVDWIFTGITIVIFAAIVGLIVFLVFLLLRKYARIRKSLVEQETLLEEVGKLNRDVLKITQEKERILAMKISQLGLKPGENPELEAELQGEKKNDEEEAVDIGPTGKSRFYKLTEIDRAMENYQKEATNDNVSLEEICDIFRNFAASKMGLYYQIKIIRLFLAAFASSRLIILQGISGTGKTSLPYAFGKFLGNDSTIASVQPSWRDRTELFGYFNEFTKRFNETEVLSKMYEAKYRDIIYLTILDEMNIARVEYYFAEMLSILEMPSRDEWVVDLIPNVWENDPKLLENGKLKLPDNMWYIGTINNDDSTFMVTDKVYDRAMPIDINDKGQRFDAPVTEGLTLSSKYLESLFEKSRVDHPVSPDILTKIEDMDNYVIEHFRLAFGNRIVKQLHEYIPAYVACGGTEIDGVDYLIAKKILRKFEQLNLSFIRDEIDGFIAHLEKLFGKENMNECKDYLRRLKKSI